MPSQDNETILQEESSLREIALNACKKIVIGAAVQPEPLRNEKSYGETLSKEFNGIVIEHHLKWGPLCDTCLNEDGSSSSTSLGRYNFSEVDYIVDWGISKNMIIKGHVLIWHVTTPSFIMELPPFQLKAEIKRHIFTTMSHFRDRIFIWDVVNEALAPDGSLAKNAFLEKLGPEYIDYCFQCAHEADPNAFLIYNDNKVEGIESPKSEAFYQLLKRLKEKNIPVHGAGIQAHFKASGVGIKAKVPSPQSVKAQIRRIGDLGLKVNISEMDVRTLGLEESLKEKAQCDIYHDILAAALSEPSFDGVWLWGFTDKHTWVEYFYEKGAEEKPLIFDKNYQRKDTYFAIQRALRTLNVDGIVGGNVLKDNWGKEWRPKDLADESKVSEGDSRPDWLL